VKISQQIDASVINSIIIVIVIIIIIIIIIIQNIFCIVVRLNTDYDNISAHETLLRPSVVTTDFSIALACM